MRWFVAVLAILMCVDVGRAQEELQAEQWKKMYQDALQQLNAAQNRRNELAKENERLTGRINQLQQQLDVAGKQYDALAEKTFTLRAQWAVLQDFFTHHSRIRAQWQAYLEGAFHGAPGDWSGFVDTNWPLSSAQ